MGGYSNYVQGAGNLVSGSGNTIVNNVSDEEIENMQKKIARSILGC